MGRNPENNRGKFRAGAVAITLLPFSVGGIGLSLRNRDSEPAAALRESTGATHVSTPPTTGFLREITTTTLLKRAETTTTRPTSVETTTTTTRMPSLRPIGEVWTGKASYYSRAGCIGCSPDRTMANGQPLDDNGLTVAFNRADLGTRLKITNPTTNKTVIATVTDTGGFEKFGILIDLTLATKNALDCAAPCTVQLIKVA